MGVYALRRMRERQQREQAETVPVHVEDPTEEELAVAEVNTVRRYYRVKARGAQELGEEGLYLAWKSKLANDPVGTPLPVELPAQDKLAAYDLPYLYVEDLDGADVAELTQVEGIGKKTAEAILQAISS